MVKKCALKIPDDDSNGLFFTSVIKRKPVVRYDTGMIYPWQKSFKQPYEYYGKRHAVHQIGLCLRFATMAQPC